MCEISIIIILTYQKSGLVGPAQKNSVFLAKILFWQNVWLICDTIFVT